MNPTKRAKENLVETSRLSGARGGKIGAWERRIGPRATSHAYEYQEGWRMALPKKGALLLWKRGGLWHAEVTIDGIFTAFRKGWDSPMKAGTAQARAEVWAGTLLNGLLARLQGSFDAIAYPHLPRR